MPSPHALYNKILAERTASRNVLVLIYLIYFTTQVSHKHHTSITQVSHKYHTSITQVSHKYHTSITRVSHKYHTSIIRDEFTQIVNPICGESFHVLLFLLFSPH